MTRNVLGAPFGPEVLEIEEEEARGALGKELRRATERFGLPLLGPEPTRTTRTLRVMGPVVLPVRRERWVVMSVQGGDAVGGRRMDPSRAVPLELSDEGTKKAVAPERGPQFRRPGNWATGRSSIAVTPSS